MSHRQVDDESYLFQFGDESVDKTKLKIFLDEVFDNKSCSNWLGEKLDQDLSSGNYRSFTNAFYANRQADRYDFMQLDDAAGIVKKPVKIEALLQIQAINDINLNGQYMDATISLSLAWTDPRLQWDEKDFNMISV